ncbi:RNA polymerase sigma-70 factor [Chitinophaga ginsengisoli]|uniref:RNA polymerase sigma-70 factor (ECF subfamily) n=1 Tax=Chitinophaga ginsengisoli TaxID=363837 RepID=A0A2P8FMR5_9BACT|nr:RNA polymerase sigma-70 factor [Chitinophaga ginsengisoli]PSL23017.1 RNA polymerase sigma-70 factor (ECF subfamily) [Chitinophaga ginsengisoli]
MGFLIHVDDRELVVMLQAGDAEAFTELYNRYKNPLIIHSYKKIGDFEDAKEIVQEVFSTLWSQREQLPSIQQVSGYLYTMVRNKVLNYIEHKQVEARYALNFQRFIDEGHNSSDIQVREKELQQMIDREIAALPPKMREVFILSRKEHLTHKEIAERLNISEFTVKNHIKGALKILRLKIGLCALIALHYFF